MKTRTQEALTGWLFSAPALIGVAIFMGYTAYDTQKIKQFHQMYGGNPELAGKASILCALQLYLDFINLFLYILRLLGRRSD